jgi:hypothetical protein
LRLPGTLRTTRWEPRRVLAGGKEIFRSGTLKGGDAAQEVDVEVWAKRMEDGSVAAGLFNRDEVSQTVTANWTDLALEGTWLRQRSHGTRRVILPPGYGVLAPQNPRIAGKSAIQNQFPRQTYQQRCHSRAE